MPTFYVSKSGNDGNSGASEVLAKLTIGSAISAASAGDTISIGDGVWAGADMQSGATGYILLSKTLSFVLSPGATSASIDPSVVTAGIRINNASDVGLSVGAGVNIGNSLVTPDFGVYAKPGSGTCNINFDGSVTDSTFYAIYIDSAAVGVTHLTGTGMVVKGLRSGIYAPALVSGSSVMLTNPVVMCLNKLIGSGAIYIRAAGAGCSCSIVNPVVTVSHSSSMALQSDRGVSIINIDNALVVNPAVSVTTSSAANGSIIGVEIDCDSGSLTANRGRILGGVLTLDANGGIGAIIGHDASSAGNYRCNYGLISGVVLNGGNKFRSFLGHGIMLSYSQDSFACLNTVANAGIGTLLKRATRCRFNANKMYRCSSAYIQTKACTDSIQDGNEVIFDTVLSGAGVVSNPDGAENSSGCSFTGNVLSVGAGGTPSVIVSIDNSQGTIGYQNTFAVAVGASLPNPCAVRQSVNYSTMAGYVAAEEPSSRVTEVPQAPKIGSAGARQTYSPAPGVQLAL